MTAARAWILTPVLVALILLLAGRAAALGFNDVHSRDGVDVWAVGGGGSVYRSLDGGASWGSYPLGSGEHRGVAARGTRVWIVDADGKLWSSLDAGYSFTASTPAGATELTAIAFADDLNGWIAGAGGTLLRTGDGGSTWASQASGTAARLVALRFHDALEGWACGAAGTLLHTTNGGLLWTVSNPLGTTRDLSDVDHDGSVVWVAGGYGFAAKSGDGGASWNPVDLRLSSHSEVNAVALGSGGTVWLGGGGGFLRRSTDGGSNWTFARHAIVSGLTDVHFHDALRGWACAGRARLVVRTVDGGATWSVPGGGSYSISWSLKLPSGASSVRGNTFAMDPFNRNKLYCVQGKTVYASWDQGETWTAVSTISGAGNRTNAFVVSATDTLKWLAIVQDGDRVTRTVDGGATWTTPLAIAFTEYGLPLEQDPNKPDELYFGPEDGKIWKSVDFGATWFELSAPMFRSPDDLAVVADTTGVMYVSDGVTGLGNAQLWKSADGGLTWDSKKTVVGSEIPTIGTSRLDKWIAYATNWSSGGVQRTVDMGETWPDCAITTSAWGVDVAHDDPNVVMYAVYSGGKVFLSLDRGASFQSATVTGANYAVLAIDRGTYLAHQSGGVYKATITQADMPASNVQTISLLSPDGGEVWDYGSSRLVTWGSQNLPLVRLEYQTGPIAPWIPIAPAVAGPAGALAWTIPGAATTQARVRVSDANDGTPFDVSGADFTIAVPSVDGVPSTLDFGDVPAGGAASSSIVIHNSGTATLVISSATIAGSGPFTPILTSFSIPPDSSAVLPVVFEPVAATAYQDTLVIGNSSPQNPVRVALLGSGTSTTGVEPSARPASFEFGAPSPNPFRADGTLLRYSLPTESDVSLTIHSALGQRVATLVRGRQPAGRYAVRFPSVGASRSGAHLASLPSGVYFCRLQAGSFTANRRIVLIR